MRALLAAAGVLVLMGCGGPAVDHERLGDQHYRGGEFERALAEYQAAVTPSARGRLWAKLAATALQLGEFAAATEAYQRLADADLGFYRLAAKFAASLVEAECRRLNVPHGSPYLELRPADPERESEQSCGKEPCGVGAAQFTPLTVGQSG